jgi:hypothetical protein
MARTDSSQTRGLGESHLAENRRRVHPESNSDVSPSLLGNQNLCNFEQTAPGVSGRLARILQWAARLSKQLERAKAVAQSYYDRDPPPPR